MANRILIGENAEQFVIDAKARFDLEVRATKTDCGQTDFVETFIEIEGDLVDGSPDAIADLLVASMGEADTKHTARRVQIEINGTVKWDFQPADCVGTPQVINVRTLPWDGNADSHWRYAMSIYVKQPGNQAEGLLNLVTSILEVKKASKVIRKVWRVSAKGKTLQQALNGVMAFKPTGAYTQEEIERFPQDKRVTATWLWEPDEGGAGGGGPNAGVIGRLDTITITGGADDYVPDPQVGMLPNQRPGPILHLARTREITVTLKGFVRGYEADKLTESPPVLKPQRGKVVRAPAREVEPGTALVDDPTLGIYRLSYDQVWIVTERTRADVKKEVLAWAKAHNWPIKIRQGEPPADGKAAAP